MLHQGLTRYLPVSFGTVTIIVGAVVLLLWIPLRQWPGLGTISNVFVIGLAADFGLWVLPTPRRAGGADRPDGRRRSSSTDWPGRPTSAATSGPDRGTV